jgi:cytochrome b involved in lipid metabolism
MLKVFIKSTVTVLLGLALLTTTQLANAALSTEQHTSPSNNSQSTPVSAELITKTNVSTTYTLAQVASNSTRASCWTVVDGIVYNITAYINSHPGGANSIAKICGIDGSTMFNNEHGAVSQQKNILTNYRIGTLKDPTPSCSAGHFYSTVNSACTPAPAGFYVTAESSAAGTETALPCPLGKYSSNVGSTQCLLAPPGTYTDTVGSTQATPCPKGTFIFLSGSLNCQVAPIGKYVDQTGQLFATACPEGKTTASIGSDSLEDCFTPQVFIECDAGYFFDSKAGECTPAPPGYFVKTAGASEATPCPAGKFSDFSASLDCKPAPPGFFVSQEASIVALACPIGRFSSETGSTNCSPAPLGSYVDTAGATTPQLCEPGSFTSTTGATQCQRSPAGYFIDTVGAIQATPCPRGYFSSFEGSISCMIVPQGFFAASTASTQATQCASGLTTLAAGATSASDCYKPIAQTIAGFKAPKALKFKAVTNLPLITNTKAQATFKTKGSCSAKATNVTTKVKGKKVTTRMLKVIASSKAGTCSVTLTSPASGKHLPLSRTIAIKVSKSGR